MVSCRLKKTFGKTALTADFREADLQKTSSDSHIFPSTLSQQKTCRFFSIYPVKKIFDIPSENFSLFSKKDFSRKKEISLEIYFISFLHECNFYSNSKTNKWYVPLFMCHRKTKKSQFFSYSQEFSRSNSSGEWNSLVALLEIEIFKKKKRKYF